ncbi:hypothetical protein WG66_016261 [Moniliophthora roreri]|nr:hypothetical protein WG66_016261 [Moniliophthora roreri]
MLERDVLFRRVREETVREDHRRKCKQVAQALQNGQPRPTEYDIRFFKVVVQAYIQRHIPEIR